MDRNVVGFCPLVGFSVSAVVFSFYTDIVIPQELPVQTCLSQNDRLETYVTPDENQVWFCLYTYEALQKLEVLLLGVSQEC